MTLRTCSRLLSATLLTSAALWASHAQAQTTPIDKIYACASLSDAEERLSCYDEAVGRLRAAQTSGDLIALDRSDMEDVQRDGFGFELPSLSRLTNLFSRGASEASEDTIRDATAPKPNVAGRDALTAPVTTERSAVVNITEQGATPVAAVIDAERRALEEAAQADATRDTSDAEVNRITETLRAVRTFGYKKQRFFLANGQVWDQTDTESARIPKNISDGTVTVEIKRAALGSYLLQVDGRGPFIRVRRRR